jgi:hypothetical protein
MPVPAVSLASDRRTISSADLAMAYEAPRGPGLDCGDDVERGPEVVVEHAADLVGVEVDDGGAASPAADRVDQHVDPAEAGAGLINHGAGGVALAQVRRHEEAAIGGELRVGGQRFEPIQVGADQDEPRSVLCKAGGDRMAERTGGTGDEDDRSFWAGVSAHASVTLSLDDGMAAVDRSRPRRG